MLAWQRKLIEILATLVLLVGAYWYVGYRAVDQYKTEQLIVQAEVDRKQQAKYDKLAEDYEALKNKRQANAQTITRTYEKIIEKPIYSVVCIEPSGLQLANEAIAGKPATQLNTKMPSDQTP